MPLPESRIGIAIIALWYFGKKQVTLKIIEKIEKKFKEKLLY